MNLGRSAVTSANVSHAIRYTASAFNVFMKLLAQAERNELRKELAGLAVDYRRGAARNVQRRKAHAVHPFVAGHCGAEKGSRSPPGSHRRTEPPARADNAPQSAPSRVSCDGRALPRLPAPKMAVAAPFTIYFQLGAFARRWLCPLSVDHGGRLSYHLRSTCSYGRLPCQAPRL